MDIKEQASIVVDRIMSEFDVEFSAEVRTKIIIDLLLLAEEFPAPSSEDGAGLIAAERFRQIHEEGWSSSHDDEHDQGEMINAALAYAAAARGGLTNHQIEFCFWPWSKEWWKPSTDPIRNLIRAGALIAAEIDRLKRLEAQSKKGDTS